MFFPDPRILYDLGVIPPGGETDEVYQNWAAAWEGLWSVPGEPATRTAPGYGVKFWVVLRIPCKDLDTIMEFSEELDMYLPKKGFGEIWGVATSQAALDKLVSPHYKVSSGASGEPAPKGDLYQVSSQYVFLTYKIRVRTEEQWGSLLHFLGTHGMIEQDP